MLDIAKIDVGKMEVDREIVELAISIPLDGTGDGTCYFLLATYEDRFVLLIEVFEQCDRLMLILSSVFNYDIFMEI